VSDGLGEPVPVGLTVPVGAGELGGPVGVGVGAGRAGACRRPAAVAVGDGLAAGQVSNAAMVYARSGGTGSPGPMHGSSVQRMPLISRSQEVGEPVGLALAGGFAAGPSTTNAVVNNTAATPATASLRA
jgi:hypothetical protein